MFCPGEFAGINNHATNGGAMTTDVLGGSVHNNVGTLFNRTPQKGCGNSVVHNHGHTMTMSNFSQTGNVDHTTGRVANGFAIHCFGFVINQCFDTGKIIFIGKTNFNTLAWQSMSKQVVGATIEFTDGNNVVTGSGNRLDGVGDCSHTGGDSQTGDTAFQCSNTLLQHITGGVHDAGIDITLYFQIKQIGSVLGRVKTEGSGLVDGHSNGVLVIRLVGMVQCNGFTLHGVSLFCGVFYFWL